MSAIYMETMGGLANRMRLLASGLWLGSIVESRLVGFWEENQALNCPFHLLFENIDGLEISPKPKKYRFVSSSNQQGFIKSQKAFWVNKLLGIDYCIEEKDFRELIWPGKLNIEATKKKYSRMYFKTYEEFGDNTQAFCNFKPVAPISKIIADVSNTFPGNTIGIHIRRTDHIYYSAAELFASAIKAEIEKNPSSRFFLCTDDSTVEQEFKNLFGSYIITYPKDRSRQTQQGIKDAVVDIFCLAKTKKIYGSFISSFSEIAARINGAEIKYIQNEGGN